MKQLIVSEKPLIRLYNGDCMQALEEMEENQYDLAIVDPPYGIRGSENFQMKNFKTDKRNGKKIFAKNKPLKKWDRESPSSRYFEHILNVSNNQIIWGANHYATKLYNSTGWIVWDKVNGKSDQSDCELAWTSYSKGVRQFEYMWSGLLQGRSDNGRISEGNKRLCDKRIHPTQKPVALYKWLLKNYAKEGDKILDSHGGSMSIAIACYDLGFDLDLWELDEDYFKAGVDRVQKHIAQGQLFNPAQREPGKQLDI